MNYYIAGQEMMELKQVSCAYWRLHGRTNNERGLKRGEEEKYAWIALPRLANTTTLGCTAGLERKKEKKGREKK